MEHGFLTDVVALVAAGAAIAYVCFRLGLVHDRALVDFLLFTIGIEFSLEKLAEMKTAIFAGGGLQVVLASLGMMALLLPLHVEWRQGLFTGFLVALSSTAIVLKLLADRGETTAPHGRIGLGILIFQDLAVVVMVLLVPMLGGTGGSAAR